MGWGRGWLVMDGLHDDEVDAAIHAAAFGRRVVGDGLILPEAGDGDFSGVEAGIVDEKLEHGHGAGGR